jgi:hypothetical protein
MDQNQLIQDLNIKKGLPMELIQIILRFMWDQQPQILLDDITSFTETLPIILEAYYVYWNILEPGEHINWLENDMIRYANSGRPTNLGPHPKMQDIISRSFMHKKMTVLPIYNNKRLQPKTVANIFWGLFTVAERQDFILNRFQVL